MGVYFNYLPIMGLTRARLSRDTYARTIATPYLLTPGHVLFSFLHPNILYLLCSYVYIAFPITTLFSILLLLIPTP